MTITLPTLPGLTPSAVHNIPEQWSVAWYRRHIRDFLQWADVRNAKAGPGITITGNLTGPATISATGGGVVAVPGTIKDLVIWWESDDILGSSGAQITRIRERTPWITGVLASCSTNTSGLVTVDSATLNSLPILKWPAAVSSGTLSFLQGVPLATSGSGGTTIFVVFKGSSSAGNQAIFGGATNSVSFYSALSGAANFALAKSGVGVIGTCSTAWVIGTSVQVNVTYNASTGAFAFRQSRVAVNSGTGTTAAGAAFTNQFGSDQSTNFLNAASLAAVIIYDRVLTGAEITSVENYLNTKWGV